MTWVPDEVWQQIICDRPSKFEKPLEPTPLKRSLSFKKMIRRDFVDKRPPRWTLDRFRQDFGHDWYQYVRACRREERHQR